jgi:phage baseplate assembly protein W
MATSPVTSRVIYSDFTNDLDFNPISEDVAVKLNENSIKQSIKNILFTDRGERLFQPLLGGNIRAMLFENITPQLLVSMQQQISSSIRSSEPRCNLIDVVCSGIEDQNAVYVTILFNVINKQEPVVLEVVLERVR